MAAIEQLPLSFDAAEIIHEITNIVLKHPSFNYSKYLEVNQIALHQSDDWFEGVGSLFDYDQNKFTRSTRDFNQTSKFLVGTYLDDVIDQVRDFAAGEGIGIGRIRVMRLAPKTCYTLHRDPEEFRYHIPLITNESAIFIVGNKVHRMPKVGELYRFKTNDDHTAVNASFKERIHIVFDTYKDVK